MGAVKEYYKESKQEDDRMYEEWKKDSIKLQRLAKNQSIIERIKEYFVRKGIK